MARLPDALERRTILYGKPRKPVDFQALGDDYRAAGRLSDACEAYEKIPAEDARRARIADLKAQAIGEGDYFVLHRIDARGEALSAEEWRAACEKARAQGKLRYAHKCALRLADPALVAELEEALGIARPLEADEDQGADAAAEDGDPPPSTDS
ncbi:MAG: hypothetical protein D6731_05030 [Planctomycetota bacterium]|nr:MAG: hypothetical protein D6731_05030 [Planctomycetota bacterium]